MSFTIGQDDGVQLLNTVTLFELRNDFVERNQSFIQRSSRQHQSGETTRIGCNHVERPTVTFEVLCTGLTGQEVQHVEEPSQSQSVRNVVLVKKTAIGEIWHILSIITLTEPFVRERINLKGNVHFATEPNKVEKLFDSILENTLH